MSQSLNSAIAVIGIDIGKNSFHVVGLDDRGAVVRRAQAALAAASSCWFDPFVVMTKEGAKKALTLLTAAALTLLSVASGYAQTGGYYGKGKAPAGSGGRTYQDKKAAEKNRTIS